MVRQASTQPQKLSRARAPGTLPSASRTGGGGPRNQPLVQGCWGFDGAVGQHKGGTQIPSKTGSLSSPLTVPHPPPCGCAFSPVPVSSGPVGKEKSQILASASRRSSGRNGPPEAAFEIRLGHRACWRLGPQGPQPPTSLAMAQSDGGGGRAKAPRKGRRHWLRKPRVCNRHRDTRERSRDVP